MIGFRRFFASVLTVLLLVGLSVHASAWAAMTDMSGPSATAVGDDVPDGDCNGCDDNEMDGTVCAAVCVGVVAVLLPGDTPRALSLRPGFFDTPAQSLRGRTSPPTTSPPNSILG